MTEDTVIGGYLIPKGVSHLLYNASFAIMVSVRPLTTFFVVFSLHLITATGYFDSFILIIHILGLKSRRKWYQLSVWGLCLKFDCMAWLGKPLYTFVNFARTYLVFFLNLFEAVHILPTEQENMGMTDLLHLQFF